MKKLFILFYLLFLSVNVFAVDYNAEKFKDIEKMANKLVKDRINDLKKFNVKKIIIVECTGEFLQSKEVTDGAFAQRASEMAASSRGELFYKVNTRTSSIDMDKDYYSVTVDQVYELSKKIFLQNGIEVISKDLVGNHEIYKDFEFAEEKKTKGYTGGMFKDSVVKRGMKRSTTGLGLFPAGLKLIKVEKNLPKLAHDLGADAAVRILFYIDKGKRGEPILNYFKVLINAGIVVQGKNVYFKRTSNPNTPNLTLKDAIASKADIKGETKKSIDIAKYHSALLDVVNAAVDMYAYKVHELFPDSKPIQEEIIPAVEGSAAEENQQIQTEGTAPAESVEDRKTEENVEGHSVPSVPAEPAIPAQESQ